MTGKFNLSQISATGGAVGLFSGGYASVTINKDNTYVGWAQTMPMCSEKAV